MPENQREENFQYVGQFNCASSQFNTVKLPEKSRLNKCPHCLKSFIKPSGLKAHIFSHTGEKPHKCPVTNCGRYFSLLSNLRRHMKIHTKENNRNQLSSAKNSIPKIRPLLPVGLSLTNQYDSASQTDQGQQFDSSHGTAPNHDCAYFHRESVTSVEFSSLPVTPSEDFVFANTSNFCDKKVDLSSYLMTYAPITSLDTTSSLYLPSDDFQLQGSLDDAVAHIQTPMFSGFPTGHEHPPWSAMLSNGPQLSIEELAYLENLNNQYLPPQQSIYPHDFIL